MELETRLLTDLGLYQSDESDYHLFDTLRTLCESPIEHAFWSVAYFEFKTKLGVILQPQYPVDCYRLDFALINSPERSGLKIAIELDGHETHKTKEQRMADAARERYLLGQGWVVIRFTGSDIWRDLQGCIDEVITIIGGI